MGRNSKILDRQFIPAGRLIIEQGALGNRAYLIESGKVEVFMKDNRGHTVKITEVGAGAIIGEMALIDGGERSASIRTIEDSILVAISARDIEESIGEKDGLFARMMRCMVERMKETNAKYLESSVVLHTLEEQAEMTIRNISYQVPENKQAQFRREVVPLLDKLKVTLRKYNHPDVSREGGGARW